MLIDQTHVYAIRRAALSGIKRHVIAAGGPGAQVGAHELLAAFVQSAAELVRSCRDEAVRVQLASDALEALELLMGVANVEIMKYRLAVRPVANETGAVAGTA